MNPDVISQVIPNLVTLTMETNHLSHSVKLKSLTALNIYKALRVIVLVVF